MEPRILRLPSTPESLKKLRAGDRVLISGSLYTARDAAHLRFKQALEAGRDLPFDISNQAIYYMGPSPAPPGKVIGACGPTTSSRMDKFTPILLKHGARVFLGKGERSQTVRSAMLRYGAVYLVTFGGMGALLSRCVKSARVVAYPELGTEAVQRLEVENFPAIVAYDTFGRDLFVQEIARYARFQASK